MSVIVGCNRRRVRVVPAVIRVHADRLPRSREPARQSHAGLGQLREETVVGIRVLGSPTLGVARAVERRGRREHDVGVAVPKRPIRRGRRCVRVAPPEGRVVASVVAVASSAPVRPARRRAVSPELFNERADRRARLVPGPLQRQLPFHLRGELHQRDVESLLGGGSNRSVALFARTARGRGG